MKKGDDIKKELEEISPFLAKQGKQEGYMLPPDYFKQLTQNVLAEVGIDKPQPIAQKESWINGLWASLFNPQFVVAFATVALIVGTYFWVSPNTATTVPIAMVESDFSLLEAYVLENIEEFDEMALYELTSNLEEGWGDLIDIELEEENLDDYIDDFIDELGEEALEELL